LWVLVDVVGVVVGVLLEVGVLLVVGWEEELEEELPPLPPHPATAAVLARTATSVSIAVSGFLLMGRAPVFGRVLGGPP
jgi:hypothetical protein